MRRRLVEIERAAALALVALALLAGPAWAGIQSSTNGTTTTSDFDKTFSVKRVTSQIVVSRIPVSFDPSKNDTLTLRCGVNAVRTPAGEDGSVTFVSVKKIRGTWSAKLLVIDELTGTVRPVELGSGKFKTDEFGGAVWASTILSDDFAEGFPQTTSALVHSEVRYTRKKKLNIVASGCRLVVDS